MWLTVFQIVSIILCWVGITANVVGLIALYRARKHLRNALESALKLIQNLYDLTKTE